MYSRDTSVFVVLLLLHAVEKISGLPTTMSARTMCDVDSNDVEKQPVLHVVSEELKALYYVNLTNGYILSDRPLSLVNIVWPSTVKNDDSQTSRRSKRDDDNNDSIKTNVKFANLLNVSSSLHNVPLDTVESAAIKTRAQRNRVRDDLPDIYLVTAPRNISTHFEELVKDGITYKRVDITDDIIATGLNRNIYLNQYLENSTVNNELKLMITDRVDVYPFKYCLNSTRCIVFETDNKRLAKWFRQERKALLNLALTFDPDDHSQLHKLFYRLGGVLDDSEHIREAFIRKIIRNLSRNRIRPIHHTVQTFEDELSNAEAMEFMLRQLDQAQFALSPIMVNERRLAEDIRFGRVTTELDPYEGMQLEVVMTDELREIFDYMRSRQNQTTLTTTMTTIITD